MKFFAITSYLVAYLCTIINANVGIPTGRIFHGFDVMSCEKYPWHAQLIYGGGYTCGGTLISDKFVLTAAHCSENCKVGSYYTVYLGSTMRDSGTKYEGKLKACIDKYDESINNDYDVALVELTNSVIRTNCIDYLAVFAREGPIWEDLPVTAIGFGTTEVTKFQRNLLETTSLRTINLHICEEEMNKSYGVFHVHICTKSKHVKGQNNCYGDSGGGLIYKEVGSEPVLLGVVSHGSHNCIDGVTVYVKVNDPYIINWIKRMKYNN